MIGQWLKPGSIANSLKDRPLRPETWKKINALFHEVVDLPEQERDVLLDKRTHGEPALRAEVDSLLSHHQASDEFLATPPPLPDVTLSFTHFQHVVGPYRPGDEVSDFKIQKLLGSGSFGTVYLALQLSLDREVALKVTPDVGQEARTMADLEHDNIVQVYSETHDQKNSLRLVCMQYVPGPNLEQTLARYFKKKTEDTRPSFLTVLDSFGEHSTRFDPQALKERDFLGSLDFVDTTLWFGIRLAHALAYAHERGVLHLDVKPGNILLTPYGRPMLVDFNISLHRRRELPEAASLLGGTRNYMPPEQAQLFLVDDRQAASQGIDHRADIYSLGRVLSEAIHGGMSPNPREALAAKPTETLEIEKVLAAATHPDPEGRFESAKAMAQVLQGCLDLRRIVKALPKPGAIGGLVHQHPITALVIFTLLPHLFGSVVNISYNSMRIVSSLSSSQQEFFTTLVVSYNLAVYPLCTFLMVRLILPVIRYLKDPAKWVLCHGGDLERIRHRVLNLPLWLVLVATLGWLPGILYFPIGLHLFEGPLPFSAFMHFLVSFTLSWLIAITYTFLYSQFIGMRILYPQMWAGATEIQKTARRELDRFTPSIRLFHFCAGIVPLFGAILVVQLGPRGFETSHYGELRFLVTFLIGLGMLGLVLSIYSTNILERTLFALTGSEPRTKRK